VSPHVRWIATWSRLGIEAFFDLVHQHVDTAGHLPPVHGAGEPADVAAHHDGLDQRGGGGGGGGGLIGRRPPPPPPPPLSSTGHADHAHKFATPTVAPVPDAAVADAPVSALSSTHLRAEDYGPGGASRGAAPGIRMLPMDKPTTKLSAYAASFPDFRAQASEVAAAAANPAACDAAFDAIDAKGDGLLLVSEVRGGGGGGQGRAGVAEFVLSDAAAQPRVRSPVCHTAIASHGQHHTAPLPVDPVAHGLHAAWPSCHTSHLFSCFGISVPSVTWPPHHHPARRVARPRVPLPHTPRITQLCVAWPCVASPPPPAAPHRI
jgi:hypothetical protein